MRKNEGGRLYSTAYGRTTGFALDSIEKKPLYHFYPGSRILSFGTVGCNLGCKFCQNWHISKIREDAYGGRTFEPEDIVRQTRASGSVGIAFTYNDPVIFGEWVMAVSKAARREDVKAVMVTNGYITPEARPDVYRHIDAANVDLKGFTDSFYRSLTLSHLEPVLDTLKWLVHETDVWVEITTLLIPGENDDPQELDQLAQWVADELGTEVPLHFTAFHPDFRMLEPPPTPADTLVRAREIALGKGLKFVYMGNVFTDIGQNTECPRCGSVLIRRQIYHVNPPTMVGNACPDCGQTIPGHFARAA